MPFFKSLALLYCSECFAAISSTFLLMPLWVMTCAISAKQTYDPLNKKVFNAYFSAIFCNTALWFWRIKNWFATRQKIEIEYFEINSRFLGAKISFRWKCSYDIWKPFDFDKDIKFKNDSLTSFLGFSETHCWSLPILSFLLSWRSHINGISKKPRFLKLRTGFVVVTDWSVPLRPSAWKASSGPNCK